MPSSGAEWFSDELVMDYYCNFGSVDDFNSFPDDVNVHPITTQHILPPPEEYLQRSLPMENNVCTSLPPVKPQYPINTATAATTTTTATITFSSDNGLASSRRPKSEQVESITWDPSTRKHANNIAPKASSSRQISFSTDYSGLPPTTDYSQPFGDRNVDFTTLIMPTDGAVSRKYGIKYHPATVLAERKRRQKLSERLIALSAIVPGLKKLDKASVLGEAANYIKQLQERAKSLENQMEPKKEECVILAGKSEVPGDDKSFSSSSSSSANKNFDSDPYYFSKDRLPEIAARVLENKVLIKIICGKTEGCLNKILSEIRKLRLDVVSSSALPFGDHVLEIKVLAQMDTEFCMTTKDLVRNLESTL